METKKQPLDIKRALTNQTAKKIFNKEAPTNKDSAITRDPGNA